AVLLSPPASGASAARRGSGGAEAMAATRCSPPVEQRRLRGADGAARGRDAPEGRQEPGSRPVSRFAILGSRGFPSYYGGFETLVRHLAPYLVGRGHNVAVYSRAASLRAQGETIDGVD